MNKKFKNKIISSKHWSASTHHYDNLCLRAPISLLGWWGIFNESPADFVVCFGLLITKGFCAEEPMRAVLENTFDG